VHKSELELFIVGDIAEGGGDLTVVSELKVELTEDVVLLLVSIQLALVALSQPSAYTCLAIINIKTTSIAITVYIKNDFISSLS
jgi:hypothetical protein